VSLVDSFQEVQPENPTAAPVVIASSRSLCLDLLLRLPSFIMISLIGAFLEKPAVLLDLLT
jgi:hypothetical protein